MVFKFKIPMQNICLNFYLKTLISVIILIAIPILFIPKNTIAEGKKSVNKPSTDPAIQSKAYEIHPGLRIDPTGGRVMVDAEVCLDSGILEFLMVQGKTKDYESAFRTNIKPSQLLSAFLLLNIQVGDTLTIQIFSEGKRKNVWDFISFRGKPKQPASLQWKLTGSTFAKAEKGRETFMADQEGMVISLMEQSEAIMEIVGPYKDPYKNANFGFSVNKKNIPTKNTQVTLIFKKDS